MTFTSTLHSPRRHFDYIDLLRGIAILGVLSAHATLGMSAAGFTQLPLHVEWLLGAGKHGVSLFFVVSAYTLMRSLDERRNDGESLFVPYLIRRIFRIAPAYYLVLLLVFFLHGKGFGGYTPRDEPNIGWPDLAVHLLFVNGLFPYYINNFIGVEWSIATEFMFYAMLPFIFLWLRNSRNHASLAGKAATLYVAGLVSLWFMYFKGGYMQKIIGHYPMEIFGPWIYFFILSHIHEFAAGIAIWVLMKILSEKRAARLSATTTKLMLGALVAFGVMLAYAEAYWASSVFMTVGGQILWGLLGASLIYVLSVLRPGPVPWLSFLGKISFSLYLVHMPVFYGLTKFAPTWSISSFALFNFSLYLFIALSVSLTTATLLFHFAEKPGMRAGKALLNRSPKTFFAA